MGRTRDGRKSYGRVHEPCVRVFTPPGPGVHPSLSGHRILGVVSRFKRLDQDVEQGQPSIVIEEGQNGPPYGAEGSPPEGLRDSGVSDGTVNLGAYSEAAEKLWRKARARGQGDIHVATSPARLRGCATPSAGLARWGAPSPNTWPPASRRGALNIPEPTRSAPKSGS